MNAILISLAAVAALGITSCDRPHRKVTETPGGTGQNPGGAVRPPARIHELISSENRIQLKAKLPETTKTGDPLPVDLLLTNQRPDTILLTAFREEPRVDMRITIKDSNGRDAAFTEEGRGILVRPGVQHMNFPHLKTGQSYPWNLDLAKWFILPAGEYSLRIEVQVNNGPEDWGLTFYQPMVSGRMTRAD